VTTCDLFLNRFLFLILPKRRAKIRKTPPDVFGRSKKEKEMRARRHRPVHLILLSFLMGATSLFA
jgi:hypothetical protein